MTKSSRGLAMLLAMCAVVSACGDGKSDGTTRQSCAYSGKSYPDRTSWMAADGCNECTCLGGHANCSLLSCDAGMQGEAACTYEGTSYLLGVTFPSTDGCNICECSWVWYRDVTPGPLEVACTASDCSSIPDGNALPGGNVSAGACVYGGKTYPADVYFQSADGCDECHCRTDGLITCTFRHIGCR
jgi:hypothetical protein